MSEEHLSEARAYWDARVEREVRREDDHPAKRVHTDLLRREIERTIAGRAGLRILDAGGGTGRFSIPLAAAGHRLTHFDLSDAMLTAARLEAARQGVPAIEFLQGSVHDLSRFPDRSFDIVLCLDAPLSFCGERYEAALLELVRVTSESLILCVVSTTGIILEGATFDLKHFGRLRTVWDVYRTGILSVNEELRAIQPTLMPTWKSFRPDELKESIGCLGLRLIRLSAPGTLARFIEPGLLAGLFGDAEAYADYLDFEEALGSHPSLLGVGSSNACGLLATCIRDTE